MQFVTRICKTSTRRYVPSAFPMFHRGGREAQVAE
jgi:hypothetical protein